MLEPNIRQYWLYLFPLGFIIALCVFFEPTWMTNDDAAMSMIAHGYGAIAQASPKLVFSNVLWGHWVQAIPTFGGVYGYSLATLGVLAFSATCLVALLVRAELHPLIICLLIALILIQAVLIPQFTVTAGLISIAAVLMAKRYSRTMQLRWLALACFSLIIGFLIRREETILICVIALPLLPWTTLFKQGKFLMAACLTGLLLIAATIVDLRAYDDPEWHEYQTLLPAVVPLVAFDAMPQLVAQPDLLDKHRFSENDIRLVERWLWFDREVASAERLQLLTDELGQTTDLPLIGKQRLVTDWPASIKESFLALTDRSIAFLLLVGLLALAIKPSKPILASWLLFATALALMGAIGRPGELRVYIPALILLTLAPLIGSNKQKSIRNKPFLFCILALVLLHITVTVEQALDRQKTAGEFRTRLSTLPADEMVAGYYSTFKANLVYSMTGAANLKQRYNNLYLFGWPAVAPYSVSYKAETEGNGFKKKLFSDEGIWILINNETLLEQYCDERGLSLTRLTEPSAENGGAKRIRCQPKEAE